MQGQRRERIPHTFLPWIAGIGFFAGCAGILATAARPASVAPKPVGLAATESSAESTYPFEVRAPFHAGLFHWLDSIAGTSGGKTIPVYRKEFARRFSPTLDDRSSIRAFREARVFYADGGVSQSAADARLEAQKASGMTGAPSQAGPASFPPHGYSSMLGVFLETDSLEASLARLGTETDGAHLSALTRALESFKTRYRSIWGEAHYLPKFVADLDQPGNHRPIEKYLAEMARFFGVSATDPPRPRLILVPVPPGDGTHAQAVGVNLLLEIRPGDKPLDQISVIAHENAHFLFERIPQERRHRLEEAAIAAAPQGHEVWELLHEALPTALGQGVAQARTHPLHFTLDDPWYHIPAVDRLAKKIYPIVEQAMDEGRPLDESLVTAMVRAGR